MPYRTSPSAKMFARINSGKAILGIVSHMHIFTICDKNFVLSCRNFIMTKKPMVTPTFIRWAYSPREHCIVREVTVRPWFVRMHHSWWQKLLTFLVGLKFNGCECIPAQYPHRLTSGMQQNRRAEFAHVLSTQYFKKNERDGTLRIYFPDASDTSYELKICQSHSLVKLHNSPSNRAKKHPWISTHTQRIVGILLSWFLRIICGHVSSV